jgi:nucleotide-binding universal stress UspA family protein
VPPLRSSAVKLLRPNPEAPEPGTIVVDRVLLASEGRPISPAAIEFAARLAKQGGGKVHVFSVARVWGSGLGLPNPGLLPSKGEWDVQKEVVRAAVEALKRLGIDATGQVLATRKATKRIVREAARLQCGAIVMGADPARNRLLADLMWSQEPYRVQRKAEIPVYLAT